MQRDRSHLPAQSSPNKVAGRKPDWLDRFVRHWAVTAFVVVAVLFYLVTEHRVHFFGALPWLILLACPLLHIFMHGGHDLTGSKKDNRS